MELLFIILLTAVFIPLGVFAVFWAAIKIAPYLDRMIETSIDRDKNRRV